MLQRILVAVGLLVAVAAGVQMLALQSQAGNTVAEAFYNQMGWLGIGLAVLLLAIFVSLESRGPARPFLGNAAQCPSCRQVISQEAELCPYCRVPLRSHGAPTEL